jgi:hypothetical protein
VDLNIIGNGFDLYHGLPSSYYYFGCYLIKTDPEFYEEVGKMYEMNHLRMLGPSIVHDYDYVVENIFWSDFESHLSKVDEFFVVETSLDDLDLEYPDPVEIELEQDMSADKLKEKLAKWIRDTIDIESNYSLIGERLLNSSGIHFNDDDCFLQFNYTHSLQKLYDIDDNKIHYVHGECYGDDGDELVVGHGNDSRIHEIEEVIESFNTNYDYTQRSYNRINEYRCLLSYIRKLRKNVEGCKVNCSYFYDGIDEEVENVNVYGLSLGEVDIPYLIQVRDKWPKAKWRFSFYSDSSKERISEVAKNSLNLNNYDYNMFRFSHPQSIEVCSEIVRLRDIDEFPGV